MTTMPSDAYGRAGFSSGNCGYMRTPWSSDVAQGSYKLSAWIRGEERQLTVKNAHLLACS